MRFKWILISGLFSVGLILLPFSYASYERSEYFSNVDVGVGVDLRAQAIAASDSFLGSTWQAMLRQIDGVLAFTAQAIEAVSGAPAELLDVISGNPPETAGDLVGSEIAVTGQPQFGSLPAPQAYDGTLSFNVPLSMNDDLTVTGQSNLADLFVAGEFSITDLTVPGTGTFGSVAGGGAQFGSVSVSGNTQLNTLSVAGPVNFANVTAGVMNVTSNFTSSGNVAALGGITTGGADVDLQGGDIFAANIINEIIAGDNIEIGGTPSAPIITADVPRISLGSRVRSLNNLRNNVTLVGGTDVTISVSGSDITLDNTSDLDTVTGRGGCTDCILDAYVVDALTIASGTINNTVIGATTAAAGSFTTLSVRGGQEFRVYESGNTNYVGFQASSSLSSDVVWTLPVADGTADQFLFTDGNGNLRFDDVSVLGVVNDLPDLGDVTITTPGSGDLLYHNGTNWINATTGVLGLGDGTFLGLTDTSATYTANAIIYANASANALTQSSNFTFNGSQLLLGTSTGYTTLSVDGAISVLDGQGVRLYDTDSSAYVALVASSTIGSSITLTLPADTGSADQVLVTDGTGVLRFADVSAIGGGATTYLGLSDTPSSYIAKAIPYASSTSNELLFSSSFVFDGSQVGIGTNAPSRTLTVHGDLYVGANGSTPGLVYDDANNRVGIGTTTPAEKLSVVGGSIVQRGGTGGATYLPRFVSSHPLPTTANQVKVIGTRAYMVADSGSNEFFIVDVSDRTNPSTIGMTNLPDGAIDLDVSGNYAYVVSNISGNDFHIIDLSDPATPQEVASLNLNTGGNAIKVRGRYAYVVSNNASGADFFIIDISNPLRPKFVSNFNLNADGNGVALSGNYAFVVTDTSNSIRAYDISDPTAIQSVGTTTFTGDATSIKIRGDYAFVTTASAGDDFHIVDISDPTSMSVVGSRNLSAGANDVAVAGNYAYVVTAGTGDDLHVIDISNLTAPKEIGSTEMATGAVFGIDVVGRYAYMASAATGDELDIYDVTGLEAQTVLAHTLESGVLSVTGDFVAAGEVELSQGIHVGAQGMISDGALIVRGTTASAFLGNVSIGSTSAPYTLTVSGDTYLSAGLFDADQSSGTPGYILQATATGTRWVATSSLNIASSVTYGSDNQIPYSNGGGDGFDYSSNLTFDGSTLTVAGDILPGANLTYDLGSSTSRYVNLWAQTINVGTSTWSIFNIEDGRLAFSNAAEQAGTEALSILTSGNVGIGTTSPTQRLHVFNTTSSGILVESDTGDALLDIDAGGGVGDYGAITFYKDGVFTNQIYTGSASDDNLYIDTSSSNTFVIMEGAGLSIGTTSTSSALTVEGTIKASNLYGGATSLSTDAQGNIIRTPSDERLKTNIQPLENALPTVLALRGVSYEWIDAERFGSQTEVGFIAQEVDLILPEVVRKGGEYWSLNIQNMVAVVVGAMQEMWEVVSGNQERITELEARIDQLEARLEANEVTTDVTISRPVNPPVANQINDTASESVPNEQSSGTRNSEVDSPDSGPTTTTSSTTTPADFQVERKEEGEVSPHEQAVVSEVAEQVMSTSSSDEEGGGSFEGNGPEQSAADVAEMEVQSEAETENVVLSIEATIPPEDPAEPKNDDQNQ